MDRKSLAEKSLSQAFSSSDAGVMRQTYLSRISNI